MITSDYERDWVDFTIGTCSVASYLSTKSWQWVIGWFEAYIILSCPIISDENNFSAIILENMCQNVLVYVPSL